MVKTIEKYQRCSYATLEANQSVTDTQVLLYILIYLAFLKKKIISFD